MREQEPEERWARPLGLLAVLVYVPLLLTRPGRVVADTKSYLYLDPGRLLDRAPSMWDQHIGLGTVPHQQIGYLWPMGPYYWLCEAVGLPDWMAQRLWIGSIMVVAGAGILYLARTWRWSVHAATAAMFVYALTPFVLTLAARISVILLPYAGLPWLLAFTIRAVRRGGWRHPALFALTVATIGSVNATALVLVGIVPCLWLAYAVIASHEQQLARVLPVVAKIGVLSLGVNAWWIAGLSVQATNGIDILRYTETAEVVAGASTSHEVLRGLGYWFFYGGDRLGPWIEPSVAYTQRLAVLALTFFIPAIGLLAAGVVRWRHRAFVIALLTVGLLTSVGAHPWDHPSGIGRAIRAFLLTDAGLAMRSLPRAVPLVVLASAIAIGSLVGAIGVEHRRRGAWAAGVVVVMAYLALPPLWTRGFVPANLDRPEDIPEYWTEVAAHLDARDDGTRVLEIPGTDFASYRWGNTVDPITPGLIDRPYAARELIPYGSGPSADLLNALDVRLQEQTLEPGALAVVARLMGVGDIVARNDLQYERYNTPRPRTLSAWLAEAPGLGDPVSFGPGDPNVADPVAPLVDEQHVAIDASLPDPAEVVVWPVDSAEPIVRTASATAGVLLSGDGAGIVDAAMAGLLSGEELIRYSSTVTDNPSFLTDVLIGEQVLIVTDENRARGERWTTVRHTTGYTEQQDGGLLRDDLSDNRLPVQPERPGTQTVAVHEGVEVRATGYGNPISYTPEERPVNAVDGDPTTAWRVAAFDDAVGHRIELTFDDEVTTDVIRLVQPVTGAVNRWITDITVRFDGGTPLRAELGPASRTLPGQAITFPQRSFTRVSIEIDADTAGRIPGYGGFTSVGFAEIQVAGLTATEFIALPTDLLDAAGRRSERYPLAFVLTRQRSIPTEVTRTDEEFLLRRIIEIPSTRTFAATGVARVSARADAALIDAVLGRGGPGSVSVRSSTRLAGDIDAVASNALDGDPTTAWTSAFGIGEAEFVELTAPVAVSFDRIVLDVVEDALHSVPKAVSVEADERQLGVFPIPLDGVVSLPESVTASQIRLGFVDVERRTTTEWSTGDPIVLPIAVRDVTIGSLATNPRPGALDTDCRSDLLRIDDQPIALRIVGPPDSPTGPAALTVESCAEVALSGGAHRIETTPGLVSGLDIDQLVLRSSPAGSPTPTASPLLGAASGGPTVVVASRSSTALELTVSSVRTSEPFWLVFGQSYNSGWSATVRNAEVDGPHLVDGFANGWLVTPGDGNDGTLAVSLSFTPQQRVDLAFRVSLASLALCLLLAGFRPKRALIAPPPLIEPIRRLRALTWEGVLPTRRDAVALGVVAGVVASLVATPIVGLGVGLTAGFGTRREGWRPAFTVVPALLLGATALYVIGVQFRNGIGPGLHWPNDTGRLHPVGLAAVLLLVIDVVIDRLWHRRVEDY